MTGLLPTPENPMEKIPPSPTTLKPFPMDCRIPSSGYMGTGNGGQGGGHGLRIRKSSLVFSIHHIGKVWL